jgi:hypothetical protein
MAALDGTQERVAMKKNMKHTLRIVMGLALGLTLLMGVASAQQPSPSPSPKKADAKKARPKEETTSAQTGEEAGDYTITSSIELGARGQRVRGDTNKFRSDLNYSAGVRLFDSSFLMRSKDGKGGLFDTLLVTSSGWGGDPNGQLRIQAEKPKWYRFEGSYRRFKYFRFLDNIDNPNYLFSPAQFVVSPNPATGYHGYNTTTQMGDFDLTILPKNRTIRFNVGYSPERYNGPAFTTYHYAGNEFLLLSTLNSRANDFRVGADGTVGQIDFSFLQGFRRFRDDSFINQGRGINVNPTVGQLTSFNRQEPARGSVDYTQFSVHSLVAKKLDVTARITHSSATSNSTFLENASGVNLNPRVTGWPPTPPAATPNITNLAQFNIPSNTKRPSTLFDLGVTFLATSKFRVSNTFRVEDFEIDGLATFNDFFSITRGALTNTIAFSNLAVDKRTQYRKYQDTVEGDYQFNKNYSIHFGYRYGSRRIHQLLSGNALNSNSPGPLTPVALCAAASVTCALDETETNHTNAFFAGFKARPAKNWTIYFDGEHGTADNVFTRIGNYNYTNVRAKSRYAPNRKINFNFGVITKDNASPSEIAGVSLTDFGLNVKSRTLTSSINWAATPKVSISMGYNYNWVNSDGIVDYYYQVPPATSVFHHFGHSLYFVRNNFLYIDAIAQLFPRVSLYASYRVNQDNGQGSRLSIPTDGTTIPGGVIPPGGTTVYNPSVLGGTLINSYPMNFQSPEARLAIRINRQLDWNLGYQYYSYNESQIVNNFPASPRAQNYHAHLPYMSLRLYFGRKE